MEGITIVLLLMLAVVVSGILSRIIPLPIPTPMFQIAFGAIIGLVSEWRVSLDPQIFFLLFLPPLLFLDGWRIPREEMFKDLGIILELALGLVVFTVVGAGFFLHWLIPAMPLPVAFALAAVVSPTDPIAVSAIAQRVSIPKRMMHILEGESLLNDASGLVCLRYATAAAMTGAFSIADASVNFLWVSIGGIVIGILVTVGVSWAKRRIAQRYGEEDGSLVLTSLLIPFGAYLGAEHLHCSGILAAVAAGLTMGVVEATGTVGASARMRRNTVWDMIQFAANGVIFVLLGEQLPMILASSAKIVQVTGHHRPIWLLVYVVALTLGLAALRFSWVWLSLRLTLLRTKQRHSPDWRIVGAMSFAGVRGAITLAGVLTLPLLLPNGEPFPTRDLAIFLAMGVIITSLLAARFALPFLLSGLELPDVHDEVDQESAARIAAAEAAILAVEHRQEELAKGRQDPDVVVAAAARVMDFYRSRIDVHSGRTTSRKPEDDAVEKDLRIVGVRAERDEVFRRAREGALGTEARQKLVHELDLLETRYTT